MFKSVNKAIVALIMSVIFLVNFFFGVGIDLDEGAVSSVVNGIVAIVTPYLVWRVPNQ